MKMMKKSDCFNCHAVDQKRVGPPLIEIAEKYRNKVGALEASIERVLKGSTGVWGKIPMIPHAQHTPEEVREMVGWVYSLQPAGLVRVFHGFVGEIPVLKEEGEKPGCYRLEANYLDRGAGVVPALTASAEVFLRQRRVEAETADEIHGSLILNGGSAGGKKFVGGIAHGQYIRFRDILLHNLRKLKFHLASAGAGGAIEVRLDRPDGELLGTCEVKVNGEWEKWYEATIEIAPRNERRDLVFVFVHPEKKSGLMNLDAIEFLP
jgi:cytochrome c